MKNPVGFKIIQCMTDSLTVIDKLYSISFLVFTLILPWLFDVSAMSVISNMNNQSEEQTIKVTNDIFY